MQQFEFSCLLVASQFVKYGFSEGLLVALDKLNSGHVDKHQLAGVVHILLPTFHDEAEPSETHCLLTDSCLSQLMERVAQVDFLRKSEFEDVNADILFDEVVVAGPSRPDTSEASFIDATHHLFDDQVPRIARL